LKIRQTDRGRISDLRSNVAILAVQNRKNTRKTDFEAFAIRTYVNYEETFQPFPIDALPEPVRGFVATGGEGDRMRSILLS